ncbi:type IV pilus biogenesis/stability protein PilW [Paraferrimonas sp. SM1919]|uniref:type IV pilus biogenesis/stability protein PilW n=1 Tax=Paraferrimonas sp. SM1919 TaxID=2662263 RepID=UPI0013D2D48E|nr:type IV pilus biogenesis/stability protein PilW [Paraferrimonas sp. SM1919]
MGKLWLILISLFSLSACVTERTYSGSDIPVTELNYNAKAAALDRVQLALSYLAKGRTAQAQFNLNKALEHGPEMEEVHSAAAYYYQRVGEQQKAIESYKKALQINPQNGDTLNNFGVYLCQQQNYQQAQKLFLEAIATKGYTRMASSYENLGLCALANQRYHDAQQFFEQTLKYNQNQPLVRLELMNIAVRLEQWFNAQQQLNWLQQHNKPSAETLFLGFQIESKLGNVQAANDYGMNLLRLFPLSQQAQQYQLMNGQ